MSWLRIVVSVAFIVLALPTPQARGAAFGVSPIRVDLDRASRTGLVNVTNDEARKLSFQLTLVEWKQGPNGEDVYTESDDLVFFPRILTLDPKSRRAVRVGTRGTPPPGERAYRLFIEEMPEAGDAASQGAQIAVRLRFGVPIFVTGGEGAANPDIDSVKAGSREIAAAIHNGGNRTIRIEEIVATAGTRVVGKTAGWYVFPGITRTFRIPIAKDACPVEGAIQVSTAGGGKSALATLEASPALCAP